MVHREHARGFRRGPVSREADGVSQCRRERCDTLDEWHPSFDWGGSEALSLEDGRHHPFSPIPTRSPAGSSIAVTSLQMVVLSERPGIPRPQDPKGQQTLGSYGRFRRRSSVDSFSLSKCHYPIPCSSPKMTT